MNALHLTAAMRVIQAHEGRRVTMAWAKRRVLEAAGEWVDRDLLALRAKLERVCGCTITELAKIAATWEG